MGPAEQARIVLLTAGWCHWCSVFDAEVLRSPAVRAALHDSAQPLVADVDRQPAWLDLPGVTGLPTLALFDADARLIGLRSGALPTETVLTMLRVPASGRAGHGGADDRGRLVSWPTWTLTADEARRQLNVLEGELFIRVNDADGGFATPARRPHPAALWALVRWHAAGGPDRALRWVDLTLDSALRGESPRLVGRAPPLPALTASALAAGSADLMAGGRGWPERAHPLSTLDPFRGLRDPVEHGLYRYAEGPGWYHPHFERLAADNLAWVAVARARGRASDAIGIEYFVRDTLGRPDGSVAAHQRADPFYARLTAAERRAVPRPAVTALCTTADQARAARVWSHACTSLIDGFDGRWPGTAWRDTSRSPAPPDAVGELLLALAGCPDGGPAARVLADVVVARWQAGVLPGPWAAARLNPLVDGLCAASAEHCGPALAALEFVPFDLRYPPPLAALQTWIRRAEAPSEEASDE
ncbi:MAG: hypothetical protein KC620_05395 [Myxococcales bacterium]|nr:hypothetical protein [Myxococcales bacterium]